MFSFLEWLFNPPDYRPAPAPVHDETDELFDRVDALELDNARLRQRLAELEQDLIALRRRVW